MSMSSSWIEGGMVDRRAENHRMILVEGTLKIVEFQSPCPGQGHLSLGQAAQGLAQPGLEHLPFFTLLLACCFTVGRPNQSHCNFHSSILRHKEIPVRYRTTSLQYPYLLFYLKYAWIYAQNNVYFFLLLGENFQVTVITTNSIKFTIYICTQTRRSFWSYKTAKKAENTSLVCRYQEYNCLIPD